MSKARPWPTVANRHRTDAIMKTGEIRRQLQELRGLLSQLHDSINANNIALSHAITKAVEAGLELSEEKSLAILTTLETAPASEEDMPDIVRALIAAKGEG